MPEILDISHALAWCRAYSAFKQTSPIDEETRTQIEERITYVLHALSTLGLPSSKKKAQRILNVIRTIPQENLFREILELHSRFNDESEDLSFIFLAPKQKDLYSPGKLFGDQVHKRFPSAIIEIEEAGKCLALERATACVFHLMRTMEVALKALAKPLKIPYAPSWESYLAQIVKVTETKWSKRTAKQKQEHLFYSEACAHLSSVKVAWRNPTMHIVTRYTPEEAEEIFNSVRVFMCHLATKLKE